TRPGAGGWADAAAATKAVPNNTAAAMRISAPQLLSFTSCDVTEPRKAYTLSSGGETGSETEHAILVNYSHTSLWDYLGRRSRQLIERQNAPKGPVSVRREKKRAPGKHPGCPRTYAWTSNGLVVAHLVLVLHLVLELDDLRLHRGAVGAEH